MKLIAVLLAALLVVPGAHAQQTTILQPSGAPSISLDTVRSTATEASKVLKSSAGNLYTVSVTIGATSGYLMLFDAIAEPANGSVTPKWWWPVTSNGTYGGSAVSWSPGPPLRFTTGITAVFSSTGPFTKTGLTSGQFTGQVN